MRGAGVEGWNTTEEKDSVPRCVGGGGEVGDGGIGTVNEKE
jgi:hypothetical protein